MAWDLWSSSFDQGSYDGNCSEILEWHCDYFGCGLDTIEEDALNEESCVQVLRIMITKADTQIEELERDLLSLQNELAWSEHENWPEICCSALTERIDRLDVAVTTLKSDHADDTEMQLLLHGKPAETIHEIVKALHKAHCQDTHGQDPDNDSNNIDSNGIIREGGKEDFGTSENSKSSELLLEFHEKRSDDPKKIEELLTISLVRSPNLGVVSCVPCHSDRIILSDTSDDKVTGDEDARQSQLVTRDSCQILNQFLSQGNGNIPSEAKEENTLLQSQLITAESGQILNPFLSKGNGNNPRETKEKNITVEENVCSDDQRLAIVKGSLLIATDTCQLLNPLSSKGLGNVPCEAKEENTNFKKNVCSNDYRLAIIKGRKMYSHSRIGSAQQEESENSDLAKKLCEFAPKTARRACRKASKVAPDEDLESMNVPLQIVYPKKKCFADTESSASKENNGNNSLQVIKFENVILNAENSALISLPGMQTKKVQSTRLQLTDEEEPQVQDIKSKIAVNISKSNKHFPSKFKAQGKKKPEFEACSAIKPLNSPAEVIPSTSENVPTKRQRKPKTCTAGTILNEPMDSKITKRAVQPGQHKTDGNAIVLYDREYASTKRQRKPDTCTAGTILNEPINRKNTKRAVHPGQHEADGNAIVLYDSKFSDFQKKRRVSKLAITSDVQSSIVSLDITNLDRVPMDKGRQYNDKLLSLVDSHNESSTLLPIYSTETLMSLKVNELRSMAKQHKIEKYYKLKKSTLVELLVKHHGSC
ncbi:uncharacterized protein [Cicer arietinum]|uniref:Uncharacterized protein LOC101495849 n=1 Tax=Cicer arietinum TaxID=3827 RepID=A0A1S2XRN5_CICAR|nr:uncharacterized protein LOC101495849 [Cicer arietinum]XP_004493463.1 uncharacterized protein LOC101495849 [Cicer arietinum]